MNIRDIAERARVSTATVSRTMNRLPSVPPQQSQTELGRLAFPALLQDVQREIANLKSTEYVPKTSFTWRDSTGLNPGKGLS
jgi:DNA-binding LacI/PurR family transcriptional regulator